MCYHKSPDEEEEKKKLSEPFAWITKVRHGGKERTAEEQQFPSEQELAPGPHMDPPWAATTPRITRHAKMKERRRMIMKSDEIDSKAEWRRKEGRSEEVDGWGRGPDG